MGLIIALLVIWIVLFVLGFVIEGHEWLAVIGIVLFVATAAVGWFRNRGRIRSRLHPLVRLGKPGSLRAASGRFLVGRAADRIMSGSGLEGDW